MKRIDNLYSKIEQLNKDIKQNLFNKGIVVPIQKSNDTIKIGNYLIKKIGISFYNICDSKERIIIEGINLPQTAIIIANKLALGKWIDTTLLQEDRKYGYASFDELVNKKSASLNFKQKNYDKFDISEIKSLMAKQKKEYYKKQIDNNYRKLFEFR
jgi:hypothetical protein